MGTQAAGRHVNRKIAGGGIAALVLGSMLIAGCSSSTDSSAPGRTAASPTGAATTSAPGTTGAGPTSSATTASSATNSSSASASGTGSTSQTASSSKPTARAATTKPSAGSTASTVPSRTQKTNAPTKKLTQANSTVAPKVTAVLTSIRSAQVNAKYPGEISGNSVIFRVMVTNNSGSVLDLSNVVVTVLGANGNPASEITSSPAKPLTGSAKAGSSAAGTYVFVVPKGQRNPITVSLTVSADTTIAVFKGNAG